MKKNRKTKQMDKKRAKYKSDHLWLLIFNIFNNINFNQNSWVKPNLSFVKTKDVNSQRKSRCW
jgi:hypothetical protein